LTRALHSRYARNTTKSALIKKWITTLLLRADLDTALLFGCIDKAILVGFDISELNRDNQSDVNFMHGWIQRQNMQFIDAIMDESDMLARNTRQVQRALGLSKVELDILRFACLLHCCSSVEMASNVGGEGFSEIELCDLLSEGMGHSFNDVFNALHPTALLRESGLVRSTNDGVTKRMSYWLSVPWLLTRQVIRAQPGDSLLEGVFYQVGPKTPLAARDFKHVGETLKLARDYLRSSFCDRSEGANILLWGEPGTGKTEMARYIAQSLRKSLLEVTSTDAHGDSLTAPARLDCFRLCQAVTQRSSRSLVLFDEVEAILSDKNFADWGFGSDNKMSKGLINAVLESSKTPSIWITNTVSGVDPAYLRRFDIVLHMKSPVAATKRRIAKMVFQDVPLDTAIVDRIAENRALTPAHLQKVSKICLRLGVESSAEAHAVVKQVLNGDLEAIRAKPLEMPTRREQSEGALPYRVDSVNCDTDLMHLASSIDKNSSVRMCFFGPPGTGKTAWARHLARKMGLSLLMKEAADLLGMYVGETERKIVEAFEEAAASKSILLLDEADSFLPDRASASRQWEVSKANQFLTAMEQFQGILICTTNFMTNLDPATLRRFDFKVRFDYLTARDSTTLAMDLLNLLGTPAGHPAKRLLGARLAKLKVSHGDFAAILRRYAVTRAKPSVEQLLTDIETEVGFREQANSRPIGFLADI
jgi:transitional endoplasmic reticulum ATPase